MVNPYSRKLNEEKVVEVAKRLEGMTVGIELLNEWVFDRLHGLNVMSICGFWIDNTDLTAAKKRGIKISNTPYGPSLSLAELDNLILTHLIGSYALEGRMAMGSTSVDNLLGDFDLV